MFVAKDLVTIFNFYHPFFHHYGIDISMLHRKSDLVMFEFTSVCTYFVSLLSLFEANKRIYCTKSFRHNNLDHHATIQNENSNNNIYNNNINDNYDDNNNNTKSAVILMIFLYGFI